MDLIRSHVMVCGGTGCTSSNSAAVIAEFEKQLTAKSIDKEVKVVRTGCFGLCEAGPVCIVYPEGSFYAHVKVEDVERIVEEHLIKVNEVAEEMFDRLVMQLKKQERITENLKATNQMEWVQRMNNLRNRAEEIVYQELIYI